MGWAPPRPVAAVNAESGGDADAGGGSCDAEEIARLVMHETRTPLNAIRGFGELLLTGAAGPLSGEALEFVQQMACAGRSLELALLHLQELVAVHHAPAPAAAEAVDPADALAGQGFRAASGGGGSRVLCDAEAWRRLVAVCRAYLAAGQDAPVPLAAAFAEGPAGGLALELTRVGPAPAPADGTGQLALALARRLAARAGARLRAADPARVLVTWPATRVVPGACAGAAAARFEPEAP